jgi:type VI secretion system VasD/TssJ family lipoprotein
MTRTLFAFALAMVCAIALACGQTVVQPKEPDACKLQVVDMSILASPRINPTEAGDARPVQTRVYQLASMTALDNVDFMDLYQDDKKALGEDLIKKQEFPVYPDSRTDIRFERDEKAMYLAVVSIFRSPKGRSWYTTFELPPAPGKGNCYLKVCKDGVCADAGPQLNPHYVVWIDGTRLDSGDDRLEEYPEPGKYQRVLAPMQPAGKGPIVKPFPRRANEDAPAPPKAAGDEHGGGEGEKK